MRSSCLLPCGLLVAILSAVAAAGPTPERRPVREVDQALRYHSAEALRADWRALRTALESRHAGLYLFTPKEEYDAFFDRIERRLRHRMSDLEFFAFVARAAEMTRERHTRVGLWTSERISDVVNVFRRGAPTLPLEVWVLDDGVYVRRNGSEDDALVPGTRLVSINGRPLGEVVDALRPYVVADGYNGVSKERDIQRTFRHLYYWFVARPRKFRLEVVPPGGDLEKRTIAALSAVAMAANRERREGASADSERPPYTFSIDGDGATAVLTLATFQPQAFAELGETPRSLYRRVFARLRRAGVRTLILDLRGNAGGRVAYVRALVPYLLREPRSGTLYTATSYAGHTRRYRLPHPDRDAFRGRWIVLTDDGTWSAASQLAAFAREHGGAVIVGQETAGRYDGNTGGSDEKVRLPNTAIEIRIPRWRFDFNVAPAPRGRGVLPDHEVVPTLEQRISGADPALELARALARRPASTPEGVAPMFPGS